MATLVGLDEKFETVKKIGQIWPATNVAGRERRRSGTILPANTYNQNKLSK